MAKRAIGDEDTAALALGESLLPDSGWPAVDGRALFLHARATALRLSPDRPDWLCEQPQRPLADELEACGHAVRDLAQAIAPGSVGAVVGLPPRQRELARACLARAVAAVRAGGQVRMAMANLEGARSGERDLRALIGDVRSESRHKCRIFGAVIDPERIDRALLDAWLALDAVRPILDGRYRSRPGLFAWDRIDAASVLLAECLPDTLRGSVADLGAGFGYLACEAARHCAGITELHLYEADARALQPARENLRQAVANVGHDITVGVHWHDVIRGLPRAHDAIISNPPFHSGRADRPQLGQAFIGAAAGALPSGGQLWLVANRHLPYEATLARHFRDVRAVAGRDGFKVIHAVRGSVPA